MFTTIQEKTDDQNEGSMMISTIAVSLSYPEDDDNNIDQDDLSQSNIIRKSSAIVHQRRRMSSQHHLKRKLQQVQPPTNGVAIIFEHQARTTTLDDCIITFRLPRRSISLRRQQTDDYTEDYGANETSQQDMIRHDDKCHVINIDERIHGVAEIAITCPQIDVAVGQSNVIYEETEQDYVSISAEDATSPYSKSPGQYHERRRLAVRRIQSPKSIELIQSPMRRTSSTDLNDGLTQSPKRISSTEGLTSLMSQSQKSPSRIIVRTEGLRELMSQSSPRWTVSTDGLKAMQHFLHSSFAPQSKIRNMDHDSNKNASWDDVTQLSFDESKPRTNMHLNLNRRAPSRTKSTCSADGGTSTDNISSCGDFGGHRTDPRSQEHLMKQLYRNIIIAKDIDEEIKTKEDTNRERMTLLALKSSMRGVRISINNSNLIDDIIHKENRNDPIHHSHLRRHKSEQLNTMMPKDINDLFPVSSFPQQRSVVDLAMEDVCTSMPSSNSETLDVKPDVRKPRSMNHHNNDDEKVHDGVDDHNCHDEKVNDNDDDVFASHMDRNIVNDVIKVQHSDVIWTPPFVGGKVNHLPLDLEDTSSTTDDDERLTMNMSMPIIEKYLHCQQEGRNTKIASSYYRDHVANAFHDTLSEASFELSISTTSNVRQDNTTMTNNDFNSSFTAPIRTIRKVLSSGIKSLSPTRISKKNINDGIVFNNSTNQIQKQLDVLFIASPDELQSEKLLSKQDKKKKNTRRMKMVSTMRAMFCNNNV